jgi:hypothetical protein
MSNKNVITNLTIKQMVESSAMGFNKEYIARSSDVNFDILGKAFKDTGKVYAKLKIAVENNNCLSDNCEYELNKIKQLEQAPQAALDFLAMILSNVEITEDTNFDPNNNYEYTVVNCILQRRPGFSKTDGYDIALHLLEDGSQDIVFIGPAFEKPLVINSSALSSLNESDTTIVASTPELSKDMQKLLTEISVFPTSDIGENDQLKPNAKIKEEFVLKNADSSFDYEIIEIGNGKGRNVLKYDIDKIQRVSKPFIDAEIAAVMSSEEETIAAWNVYLSEGKYWSYTEDLPLDQNKQDEFSKKYKDYFMNNYLLQFTKNQLPIIPEDAQVFDLQEAKMAKAQAFIEANNL